MVGEGKFLGQFEVMKQTRSCCKIRMWSLMSVLMRSRFGFDCLGCSVLACPLPRHQQMHKTVSVFGCRVAAGPEHVAVAKAPSN